MICDFQADYLWRFICVFQADIKNAPSKIKEAYRTYWTLKTSVLESTIICDMDFDENAKDCFNSSNETNCDTSMTKPADVASTSTTKPTEFGDSICYQPLSETTLTQSFTGDAMCQSVSDSSSRGIFTIIFIKLI